MSACATATAHPDRPGWTYLTLRDDTHVYVRDAPAAGPIRKLWTLYDLPEVIERDGYAFRSVASLGEFDCAEMTTRTVEEAYHAKPGLAGRPIERPPIEPTPWQAVTEGSVGAMKLDYACRPDPSAALLSLPG